MTLLHHLPPELLALCPVSLAAGVDLYLTLFFLGVAPATPWWDTPLSGALGDLSSAGVLVMAGGFYLLELTAERWPLSGLFWNAFHAVIRPLAGALLALLVLDGQPLEVIVAGAALAGILASAAHRVSVGGRTLVWLNPRATPHPLLVSFAEDAAVLGLLALVLDRPGWAAALSLLLILTALPPARAQARAFGFAVRLARGSLRRILGRSRWQGPEDFPGWVRRALTNDVMAPGGGLRGAPAAGYRLPGAPRFATGWVVVRGEAPAFVFRTRAGLGLVDLGPFGATAIFEGTFFRRVDLSGHEPRGSSLYFGLDGPERESLSSEFLPP